MIEIRIIVQEKDGGMNITGGPNGVETATELEKTVANGLMRGFYNELEEMRKIASKCGTVERVVADVGSTMHCTIAKKLGFEPSTSESAG